MPRAIQTFEVSLKAAIFRHGKLLLVQESDTPYWELPGGRIDVGEERHAHADILAREIAEELGTQFRFTPHSEVVTWVRQRPTDSVYQFITARLGTHLSGDPILSAEHAAHRWTTPADWPVLEFPPLSDYSLALERIWHLSQPIKLSGG